MSVYLSPRRLRLISSFLPCTLACSALLSVSAVAQTVDTLPIDEALRLAIAQSSQIAAAQAQGRAAREMAVAAAQRPDPVVKLGINNLPIEGADRFNVGSDFMTMRSIAVTQELTRTEKLEARAARSAREADIAATAERQAAAELQRDTALAWLERSFQQSLRELLNAHTIEAGRQVEAADALYRSGRGAQADVFAARAEVEMLRDRMDQADRAIGVATTQLGRWIGDSATRPAGPRPTFAPPAWAAGDLARHLLEHPQIAAAAQQEALAQTNVAIAQANRRSDWSVELMYSQRGSSFSNMMSVNVWVPFQWDQKRRQDRELAAAQAMTERAAAERENLQRAHEAEVRAMLQEWRSHEQRLIRYDSQLLTLARQRTDATLTAYRAGTGTLPTVFAARRTELDTQIERLRIEMDIARLWAQLTFLIPHPDRSSAPVAARIRP